MAEFWVRPPFHNGELPRLLYIKRGSPYMFHLFSYNTIFMYENTLFYNKP
jgi:hypothetical protein